MAEIQNEEKVVNSGEKVFKKKRPSRRKVCAFCVEKSASYIRGVANAARPESTEEDDKLFAQLLGCEAHNDVLRELFQTWNQTNCIED